MINKQVNGIFEVGSGKSITLKYLAYKIKKVFNKKVKITYVSPKKSKKNYYSKSKINKTIKTFRWKPKTTLSQGLVKLSRNL